MKCRFCSVELNKLFIDLGMSPPSNSFLIKDDLNNFEIFYPLKLWLCENCFLVQIDEYKKANEIFNSEYAYFSSFSKSWLEHCKNFAKMIVPKFKLDNRSLVVEIASNDGYLLQFFKEMNISVIGIEPSGNTANVAIEKGIPTIVDYFGVQLAENFIRNNKKVDLLIGNNVLAHVPNINDFVAGMKLILSKEGIITMEFPHLYQLILKNQFDTIYHEHFSYLSFSTVRKIFLTHNLEIFDVEELSTHGGSIRIYAKHNENPDQIVTSNVSSILEKERKVGMNGPAFYEGFTERIMKIKIELVSFLLDQKKNGKVIAAYGAAAKGNTLLNFCGIKNDIIEFVVDASPHKQNKFLPGTHIPIVCEDNIKKAKPDYILILPWNLENEIIQQLSYTRIWGAKFIIPIPELKII